MLQKTSFIIVFLFTVGLVTRLVSVHKFPPSLNWDEVSLGYNAYSLLKTGRDEWGIPLPVLFRAFGDYKLPAYVYSAIPTALIFGPTALGARLPSVLFGCLLMVVTYCLVWKYTRSRAFASLAGVLVGFEPWTWFMSRIALEANLGGFLIALGIALWIYRRPSAALAVLTISAWAYNSARVFSPLLIAILLFTSGKPLLKRATVWLILLTGFFPMLVQLISSSGLARYKNINLIDSGAIARLNQLQTTMPGGRWVYNKATYFTAGFFSNYVHHFLPQFLFLDGGSHYQFNVPGHGLAYLANLPLFYFGIWLVIRSGTRESKILLLWLLSAPVAGSLTRDAPHTLRAVPMVILPAVFSSIALHRLAVRIRKDWFIPAYLVALGSCALIYFFRLPSYSKIFSWSWQYGYQEAVSYIKARYSQYDEIIFTKAYGEPHEFIGFFWPWNPADFQKNKGWDYHDNWYWVNSLGKFRFVNDWEISEITKSLDHKKKYLIVSSPQHESVGSELRRIDFLDHTPVFIIKEQ